MKKFDVVIALEGVREAKAEWAKAQTKFNSDVTAVMTRLLHEGARNFMSAEEIARASGHTTKRIRQMMRDIGLNPRDGKTVLSKNAAEALNNNAALLGIEPHEMDLMSPLAYLPMGEQMKRKLQDRAVSQVTELPDEVSGNWHVEMIRSGPDELAEVYEGEDFIATFNDRDEADRVCTLWNNQ